MAWQDILTQNHFHCDRMEFAQALDLLKRHIPQLSGADRLQAELEIAQVLQYRGFIKLSLEHLESCIGRLPENPTPMETSIGIRMQMQACSLQPWVRTCFGAALQEAEILHRQTSGFSTLHDLDSNMV